MQGCATRSVDCAPDSTALLGTTDNQGSVTGDEVPERQHGRHLRGLRARWRMGDAEDLLVALAVNTHHHSEIYHDISLTGGPMKTARVFWSGRSQAVRLPKEFRFDGSEVVIRREGNRIVLEPLPDEAWGEAFWSVFGAFDDDFDLGDRSRRQQRELFG